MVASEEASLEYKDKTLVDKRSPIIELKAMNDVMKKSESLEV